MWRWSTARRAIGMAVRAGWRHCPAAKPNSPRRFPSRSNMRGALKAPLVHIMSGFVPAGVDIARCHATYVANLKLAAKQAADAGLRLAIEPINPIDMPGYFLNRQEQAHAIVAEVGAANLGVQMDFYHCQMVEGGLARRFEAGKANIVHIQIAGVPGRNEPDANEIAYPYLFDLIDRSGYAGWIGCEYKPRTTTREGLGWIKPYLTARA